MKKRVNEKQINTFNFLKKMEEENKAFSSEELSEASKYPLEASLKAKQQLENLIQSLAYGLHDRYQLLVDGFPV